MFVHVLMPGQSDSFYFAGLYGVKIVYRSVYIYIHIHLYYLGPPNQALGAWALDHSKSVKEKLLITSENLWRFGLHLARDGGSSCFADR